MASSIRDRNLVALAAATVALHAFAITQYGWFRDELYYVASTDHLAWGYVDHPPLSIALLWLVTKTLGTSLVAIRLLPILAHAATVFLTGLIARRLGGGGYAQALAALAAMLAPVFLGSTHFYSMNAFDILLWTVAALVLLRALETGSTRDWIALGVVMGLGLLNKISMSWFGMGLFAGLLLSQHRRRLLTRGPWLAAVVAGVMLVPYVIWEITHGWPTLDFMRNATSIKMVAVTPVDFLKSQVLEVGPANLLIWTAGLAFAFLAREESRGRILGWIYLSVLVILMAGGHSRASYLAVAYPMLLALGGVAWERMLSGGFPRRLRGAVLAVIVLGGLVPLPFALPILPPALFIRYQTALGMAPSTEENQDIGPLPQHYADMFGWEDLVTKVAEAYARLTPEEQKRCRVFGQNYGEAGAVDVLGRRLGLPKAMSGHNSYWLWGPGDFDGSVMIIIGGDHEDNLEFFDEVEIVGTVDHPYAMPYERGLTISIARRAKVAFGDAWPRLRMFI